MRRLIVCFDGTWNTPDSGDKPTNVVKMVRAIPPIAPDGTSQITFYDKGVGTGDLLDKIKGGLSGSGLTDNVVDGYRFIANNYQPGDEIYLFGFSRGAYTARSCAGLIGLIGLFSPLHLGSKLMEAVRVYSLPQSLRSMKRALINDIGADTRRDVPIKCVGVWDTVGSLGIPGDYGRKLLPGSYPFDDAVLGKSIEVGLHALGIDEKRAAFAPTLWVYKTGTPPPPDQKIEQVWFPGVHSNVGGSMKDDGLSDITFQWMMQRVRNLCGLEFDADYVAAAVHPNVAGRGYESRTALYKGSVAFPYQRLINQTEVEGSGFGEWFRNKFKSFDRRNWFPKGYEPANEMVHQSALDRWALPAVLHDVSEKSDKKTLYRPVNLEAVIEGDTAPVVGWDGEVREDGEIVARV